VSLLVATGDCSTSVNTAVHYFILSSDTELYFNNKNVRRPFYTTVTVTVTEALVLRPLLEDRGRITESIRILVPVNRMKQKCFSDETG